MKTDLSLLEEITGYHFKDRKLLLTALTHTSYANEHRRENVRHNERLEFLGDAVLETVSSEYLFNKYPERREGERSTTRASVGVWTRPAERTLPKPPERAIVR